uniref:Uncharacterized protein n=1 Tax=Aegilops tauschii TaxID=37682 RepID=R7W4Y2_AEGTA
MVRIAYTTNWCSTIQTLLQATRSSMTLHGKYNQPTQAGIGVFIQVQNNDRIKQIHIAAVSPPASSPLQAETFGLMLATRLADILNVQDPHFFTDCSVLALAAKATNILFAPRPWDNKPLLAQIQNSPSFQHSKVTHIYRESNVKAHHFARLALKVQIDLYCFVAWVVVQSGKPFLYPAWLLSRLSL